MTTNQTPLLTPAQLQISNTYQMALALATSASKLSDERKPTAYVRLQQPYYEMKSPSSSSSSQGHSESDKLKPDGVRGRWWQETLRGVAAVEGLNFGIVRSSAWYGPGTWDAEVVPRLVAGHVYQYLEEEMKFLYKWVYLAGLIPSNPPART